MIEATSSIEETCRCSPFVDGGATMMAVTSVAPASIAWRIGALLVKPPSAYARVTPSAHVIATGSYTGGSAADAQHIAAEFLGRFRRDRRPLPAMALSADIASITAVGNDYAFDEVFERQVEAHGVAGDVAKKAAEVVSFPGPRAVAELGGAGNGSGPSLREEGAALLYKSRDVHYDEDAHPAYERILSELAPDEARILRLLLLDGPQPSVDVRTGGPIGMVSSRLIAPGLTMIGARAGCRYVERVPSYLNNLFRLGMVWFSRETLRDPLRYQVLEAQPEVLEPVHTVRYAKIVRRSIHLTPFGEDFCRMAFIEDDRVVELPVHSPPPKTGKAAQPPALTEE